jgi:glycosyltransferase involved in cell wall biosynthesis
LTIGRILALGTYPIERPVHGGQRRVAAFKEFYARKHINYSYAAIYNGTHYRGSDLGPYDQPMDASKAEAWPVSLVGDVLSGQQGAAHLFQHFADVANKICPDVLQLEQPFMWPVAKRLREISGTRKPLLIYSSQNVEAPLKRAILEFCGIPSETRNKICSDIERMEVELAREADLILCVSEADREYYRQDLRTSSPVIVVRNGVDRPDKCGACHRPDGLSRFQGRPFLMTVGSAHIPNIDGVNHFLVEGGVFCVPPVPSFAICGGVAQCILDHAEYRRYLEANSKRVQFFADISDSELSAIKRQCHGFFLPIRGGGGTNLKTAEALALGKWVVATSTALRGFETFLSADGVLIADSRADFRAAARHVLERPPLELTHAARAARDALYWDRCFDDSELPDFLDYAQRPSDPKEDRNELSAAPSAARAQRNVALRGRRLNVSSLER